MTKVRGKRVSVSVGPTLDPVSALSVRGMQPFAENVDHAIPLGLNFHERFKQSKWGSVVSLRPHHIQIQNQWIVL